MHAFRARAGARSYHCAGSAGKGATHAEEQRVVQVVEELVERGAEVVFRGGFRGGDVRVVRCEEGGREAAEYPGYRQAAARQSYWQRDRGGTAVG